ncbi:MAG: LLM class flavin-dependent oxidoreductase [Acidimicrobiia bacterium]|nr:LLM class flavin-dependent oxidoreductase [Acidimicrobiia bacterium]
MDLGMFLMPCHPPERAMYDKIEWDLQSVRWADELGYTEAWFGEHFTFPWEPIVAPDLLIAQAALQTERIRLAPGTHLLPYHHPAELALRVAQLDHMLQGRLMVGFGAGGAPSDFELFQIDGAAGEHRSRLAEALDIIVRMWTSEDDFDVDGEHWQVKYRPHVQQDVLQNWLKPLQRPHPPVAMAGGVSEKSPTLQLAGERGFIPLSFPIASQYVAAGWDAYVEGAAGAGREPDRSQWRIARDVLVAETDAEARRLALHGPMRRFIDEYFFPLLRNFGALHVLKHDRDMPDGELTAEYVCDHIWVVGSPETVADKLAAQYDHFGGFGSVLLINYDFAEDPAVWRQSLELMVNEVMPRVAGLVPGSTAPAPV